MGRLIFEGDDKVLSTISKSNRLRVKKYGLKVTLESKDSKVTIPSNKENSKESKPKRAKTSKKAGDDKKAK
jgi:hypothetical protein